MSKIFTAETALDPQGDPLREVGPNIPGGVERHFWKTFASSPQTPEPPVGSPNLTRWTFANANGSGRSETVLDRRSPMLPPEAIQPIEIGRDHFVVLGKWEGYVTSVADETFTAIVSDRLAKQPDEEAEFYLSEVSESDRPLIEAGAIFYWAIGYRDTLGGRRARASVIQLQRLPGLTKADWVSADQWAADVKRLIKDV